MSNYIVSARKYRPQSFDAVVGQKALTTTLKNAIASGKLAHAYLFCGPRGVGKTTCARIFAKTINCLTPTAEGDACGTCESCRAFDENRSYNIHELDAASNNSVDDIRSLIEQVSIPPQIGRYKVFIIDEVHMLSQSAFNAFLKTLEEPPAHAIFILATTEKHKILPTILSRCQIYDFNRMEVADIVRHLKGVAEKEGITYEEEALGVIAQKADGGMRDALSIFDQVSSYSGGNITYRQVIENLNVLDYDYYFRMTDLLLKGDITQSLLTLNEILAKGFSAQHFMGGLASHFRDLLVSRDAATLPLLEVSQNVRNQYQEQALRCDVRFLYRALKRCNDCDLAYRQSRNKRLLVELTLIEVAQAASGDDDDSAGRRPKRTLKPIFSAAAEKTVTAAARPAAPVAPTAAPATPVSPSTTAQPAQKPSGLRRLRTVSLNASATTPAATPTAATAPQAPLPSADYGETPFDQSQLSHYWLRFAGSLPLELRATAGRLQVIRPELAEGYGVRAEVESELVKADMREIEAQLTEYLRQNLRNSRIALHFVVKASNAPHRAYTSREKLEEMRRKSPELQQLISGLKLELV